MALSRREFVLRTAAAGAATQLQNLVQAQTQPATSPGSGANPAPAQAGAVALHWLDGHPPAARAGVTWGVPWPRGACAAEQTFTLTGANDAAIPLQTWPLAYWPDGSLKWTAHALGPLQSAPQSLVLAPGDSPAPQQSVTVKETDDVVSIDTGVMRCRIARRGASIIESIERAGRPIANDAKLVCLRQGNPDDATVPRETFTGAVEKVTIEQSGPVRAVVRIDGKHVGAQRAWLPFTVRLYFYAGGNAIRLMHTFIFDGEPEKDFLAGLGVRFGVPMRDQPHDRHVRFAGEGDGLWAEAVRGLTGLRRDPGAEVRQAQVAGEPTPPVESFPDNVKRRLELIPAWGDYTLSQLSADGFEIKKRTKAGHGWIKSAAGTRASGVGYVGGITGGMAFGLRDFWQRHPTQLDIRGANTDSAEVTVWLYSPEAPAMDLRFYHDGMEMDTFPEQIEGLEITYEDYEPGFGTAQGIARTSELTLWAVEKTPSHQAIADFAEIVRTPPMLACAPAHYVAAKIFGGLFAPVDRSTPAKRRIEDELDFRIAYYQQQIAQHRWYGFWDHGDVMHTYDADRHMWRYDVGGYAWANSELSPDLWLWYSFLRTGRPDIFRMAEAMTRHTGEVDVYHVGRFKGLGTRHNVQHWGCSAKQLRISTAIYRRFYYYLTADERVGNLMHELLDADQTFLTLDPIRKIRKEPYRPDPRALGVGFGTDWGSLASAWFTEWERTRDQKWRDKLLAGMKSIGSLPHGFFTSGALFDPATGAFHLKGEGGIDVSHLSAVFGLLEIAAELIQSFDVPEFERAWLQYCVLYSAPREQQQKELGQSLRGNSLTAAHSRLTAYAAWKMRDDGLARRAWAEFASQDMHGGITSQAPGGGDAARTRRIEGPDVLNPVDEAPRLSTNDAAQWSLAAIQNLALIGHALPE
ncbi:MAG TPA: hypothetical protein VGR35_22040 [Tepidisphaeraceae bacterium]|nr:hypothetical protein [Tepidisphaeraceae bacterium]